MITESTPHPPSVGTRPQNGWLRRTWLKAAAATLGAAAAFRLKHPTAAAESGAVNPRSPDGKLKVRKWGMVIDLDKCTGCGACMVACAAENNVALGSHELSEQGRVIRWLNLLSFTEGEYPYTRQRLMPTPCQQCDQPPCTAVCPVSATYKNPEGLVAQIYPRCIGCRFCVNACPYTCKYFNWTSPNFPIEIEVGLNPDVSVRPQGVTEKCSFCDHRLMRGKEQAAAENRELAPTDYVPACAEACPAQAIAFGDLNDPKSQVSTLARSPRVFRLLEELGTEPKVLYLREE
jgi:menaquinone reductase, iron-sulfur cluster-binding subunit